MEHLGLVAAVGGGQEVAVIAEGSHPDEGQYGHEGCMDYRYNTGLVIGTL